MPRYDVPKAAPAPLRLVQLFVNTSDHEHGRELLSTPSGLAAWLDEQLTEQVGRATAGDHARAIELREALRALLLGNNGLAVSPEAVVVFNAVAARLSPRVNAAGQVALEPEVAGVDGALARIAAVAVAAMFDGSWRRLKACGNCGWGYYDYSRNRSARWCSMLLCGNRSKTRAYRSRKAAG